MKTVKFNSFLLAAGLAVAIGLTSCESNEEVKSQEDLLPKSMTVEIPASISQTSSTGGRIGRVKGDSIKGNDIYKNLGTFIAVGKVASKITQDFIDGIRKYKIDRVKTLT